MRSYLSSAFSSAGRLISNAKKWVLASSVRAVFLGLAFGALIVSGLWLSSSSPASSGQQGTAAQPTESSTTESSTTGGNPDTKTMPHLLGLREGEFEEDLLGIGVNQWATIQVDSDHPAGVVVDTKPAPGDDFSLTAVNEAMLSDPNHDGVLLMISNGKTDSKAVAEDAVQQVEVTQEPGTGVTGQATMPNLIGLTKQQASNALKAVGILTFGYQDVPSNKPAGSVVSQSHAKGTQLDIALFNRTYDPNNQDGNHIQFTISTGYDQAPSSTRITSEDTTIRWEAPSSRASWGFYAPSVKDGILTIRIDAKFAKNSEINLEPSVAYAKINGDLRIGFLSNLPKSVNGAAGQWITPINLQMKISNLGINEPTSATIRLRVKEGSETYIETLTFIFGEWK